MKYSEAIKIAEKNPEFARTLANFKKSIYNGGSAGSVQFAIGDEAFFYAGESIYNEATGEREYEFRGGKHTPRRAAYLINRGETFIIA